MAELEGAGIPLAPEGYCGPRVDTVPEDDGKRPSMTRGDVPVLLLALALSFLWMWASDASWYSLWFLFSGGAPLSVSIVSFLACAVIVRRGLRDLVPYEWFLLVATVALAIVPALSANAVVRELNAVVLAAVGMLTFLVLTGGPESLALSVGGIPAALGAFVGGLVRNVPVLKPTHAMTAQGRRTLVSVLWGLLAAGAVLAVVVPLLLQADRNFGSALDHLLGWLDDEWWVWRVVRFLVVALATFSLLYSVAHAQEARRATAEGHAPTPANTVALTTMLALLDSVYLLFVIVQFQELFGGHAMVGATGAYASYARQGFFELAGVSAINIAVALACVWRLRAGKRSIVLLVLQCGLLAAIAVMLASSALRMGLYVERYGLTMLRALTYVGMVSILMLGILTAVRLFRPWFRLYRWSLASLLVIWLAFGLSVPATRIAEFDVNGYLNGSIEEIDIDYLYGLGPDASGALDHLAEERPGQTAFDAAT